MSKKNRNTGYYNTGDYNTGDRNTGYCNTGYCNTGYWNTGSRNTGSRNTGDYNTGDYNTGYWNTGYCNTGKWNTGYCNTGDRNTGYWNTGSRNTGYCNTIDPTDTLVFNKICTFKEWDEASKPSWMYNIYITQWIYEADMTHKEKEAYPSYVTTGGYLKVCTSYHQAAIEAWERATPEDRALTAKLPNYDREVFKEIFGFYADEEPKKQTCAGKIVEIEGVKYELMEVK